MPLKRNTARELPVILIDETDFITGLTPVVFGDVICKYRKDASSTWVTKTIDASNWGINTNKPAGNYTIDFTAGELNINGLFEYNVVVSGALTYSGLFEIRDNTNDNLKTAVDTRAPSSEYDTPMARINVDLSSRAAPGDIDTAHGVTNGKIDVVDGNVNSIKASVDHVTYGLSALKTILDGIKGAGWTDETLKSIKETVDAFTTENYNGSAE